MKKTIIGILSLQHAGIDFLCALVIFGRFIPRAQDPLTVYLLYNFCAFALQMPLGVIADRLSSGSLSNRQIPALIITCLGVILTSIGCYTSLLILGLGNALFHVGGGMITIREDDHLGLNGRGLGVFVAPGALGLCAGTLLAKARTLRTGIFVMIVLLLLSVFLMWLIRTNRTKFRDGDDHDKVLTIMFTCFLVVVLRSFVGLAMVWPWKNTALMIILSVIAVASGKTAGGFLAAQYGTLRTSCISLLLSALCFAFGNHSVLGILGLFFFNMTMPITLYALKQAMPSHPGLAFGILTFALFIGLIPYLYSILPIPNPRILGSLGSLLSLVILLVPLRILQK